MSEKAIVWIRDDFRLKNNSAFSFALNNHNSISAVYIYNNENLTMLEKLKNGG